MHCQTLSTNREFCIVQRPHGKVSNQQGGYALLLVLLVNALLVAFLLSAWNLQQQQSLNNKLAHNSYQQQLAQQSLVNAVGNYLAQQQASQISVCLNSQGYLQLDCQHGSSWLSNLDTNASFADGSSGALYRLSGARVQVDFVADPSRSKSEVVRQIWFDN